MKETIALIGRTFLKIKARKEPYIRTKYAEYCQIRFHIKIGVFNFPSETLLLFSSLYINDTSYLQIPSTFKHCRYSLISDFPVHNKDSIFYRSYVRGYISHRSYEEKCPSFPVLTRG